MKEELYEALGEAKCEEMAKKSWGSGRLLGVSESRKNAQIGGLVRECIARDFIREFLPQGFGLKNGLIFDTETKKASPQIDAIIYRGAPLLEFSDVVFVEKEQVKAIFEIKTWIYQTDLFGAALASAYMKRKAFLPKGAEYILFAFELHSKSNDVEVIKRLNDNEICDSYAVVIRRPRRDTNFDGSIGRLIEWLRNLS